MEFNLLVVSEKGKTEWDKLISHLRRKGIAMQTASTSGDAYKILRNEPINIVLADYNLPKLNSLQFLKKIKQLNRISRLFFLQKR